MALSSAVRYFFLILMCACIVWGSGCATVKPPLTDTPELLTQLPPQNLASGQCGLFIWTVSEPKKFIGFETETQSKFFLEGNVVTVTRFGEGSLNALERVFKTKDGLSINLGLEPSYPIDEGQRFLGSLTIKTQDGWDKITPIVAISSCVS